MTGPTSDRPPLPWRLHWQPAAALIATGVAYALVSDDLRLGPFWLLPRLLAHFPGDRLVATSLRSHRDDQETDASCRADPSATYPKCCARPTRHLTASIPNR